MQANQLKTPPCTVTAKFEVKLLKPTPMGTQLRLEASCVEIKENKVITAGRMIANNSVCDTFLGSFVAVPEDHPGYHRW